MQALCENGTLASFDHVVLADPYASNARRCFFQDHQAVSDRYLLYKPGLSDADWRSFFESASKAINGPFRLTTSARQLTQGELRKTLPDYEPPYTKAVPINTRWEEWSLHSENYLLIDATLPQELATALAAGMTPDEGRDAGLWLNEARQDLPSNARLRVAYVPYGCGFVSVDQTKFLASWVQVLQDARWVCATKGGGPHAPASVLARGDPARPDAPVASLPEELVKTLASCGISFGSSIPGVTSIERLRREAPSADAARLVQLLETAIGDAQNEPKRQEELEHVLRTCAFVPLKESGQLIDRAGRVSAERLVQRSARGAELGRWLLSIDAATKGLGDDDAYARLLRLIASVCAVPDAPTWEQALAFVQWVWEVRPDAELVRRTLPRAYRLIAEDMNADPARVEKWDQSRAHANVYVATREWVSVLADDLFLDDLGDERLKGMVGKLLLATPGHLGETVEEQLRVASLLGISRLSTRFQVALRLEGEKPLPAAWAGRLGEIVTLVQSYAQEEDGAGAPADPPIVSYYQRISKSLVGNGAKTNAWEVHAARDGARVCLSGEPDDFAAHLCRVLLQWAGLTSRRDLDELAPTLTQLIGWMDRLEKFVPRLEQLRTQLELQPSLASVPPPTDITSLTRPKLEPTGLSSKPTDSALEPLAQPPSSPTTPLGSTPPGSTTDAPQSGGRDGETGSSVEDRKGQDLVPPPPSGGYTSDDRERRLQAVRKRRAEFEAQEGELLGVGPLPDDGNHAAEHSDERSKKFGSDVAFREAALEYERLWDRYPVAKDANQPGHDIDSFDKPLEGSDRRLVRRIEVKGRGSKWEDDETVELSDRQFLDALTIKSEGVSLADDFDYWLYVVERWEDGALHVLPIRNPAKRAAKFEFRGGTWRALADEDTHSPGPYGCFRMDSD